MVGMLGFGAASVFGGVAQSGLELIIAHGSHIGRIRPGESRPLGTTRIDHGRILGRLLGAATAMLAGAVIAAVFIRGGKEVPTPLDELAPASVHAG